MRTNTPASRLPSSDFSAGASSPQRTPRQRRALQMLGWLLAVPIALLLAATVALWWWAGSGTSLATTLARAAQYLPAGQQLESREVTGTLRGGGRIGWLRWSSPTLAIEVDELTLGWQLAPLLQRRLELRNAHAARVHITPQASTPRSEPATPLSQLVLPLEISLPFRVDDIVWAGAPALQVQGLAGDYHFDGREHRLNIDSLALADGRYTARMTLQAQSPMALDATVSGAVDAAVPGGGAALQVGAHATLQGTLASAAAQLQLQASVAPIAEAASADAMQAELRATLAPWAHQPLQAASATLRAVNLAALWPLAPITRLHGTVRAGPTPGNNASASGWALQADLRNDLAGPWDKGSLPLTALQAQASYDGTRWNVPSATATMGVGTATLQGHYAPATGAVEGLAELRNLRPDTLHTALAAAPLAGRIQARMQGEAVNFEVDIRAAGALAARTTGSNRTAPLRINAVKAQGRWTPASAQGTGGSVWLDSLLVDALQARAEATRLQVTLADVSAQGQLTLRIPGASAHAQGSMGPHTGAGELQVQSTDTEAAQRWLTGLPWFGPSVQSALQGVATRGSAQWSARWKGGWQTLEQQLQAASAGSAQPPGRNAFEVQSTLSTPRLDILLPQSDGKPATALQLRAITAELSGTLTRATLSLNGEARLTPDHTQPMQRVALQTRLSGGLTAPAQWQAQLDALRLQAYEAQRPSPWTLQLAEPVNITARRSANRGGSLTLNASAGLAHITGPAPGSVALRWQPVRAVTGSALQLQTQGSLQGLPMAWVDALEMMGTAPTAAQPLLARMGLASNIMLDGQWSVDTSGTPLRASASLRRASGDLGLLTGDMPTQAPAKPALAGMPAGVRQAEIALELEGEALRARLIWASERAGEIEAHASTRLTLWSKGAPPATPWATDAPLTGSVRARLPDMGVWSALAPPGWRVRGTLSTNATLSGTRDAPRWAGTLGADDLAVRSVIDGVDLRDGRLRATLHGSQLDITEFRLQGGRGSGARIPGFSGNRTAPPQQGGTLTGTGRINWGATDGAAAQGLSGIAMDLRAEAQALQVLVRADRQLSVSGQLQAQLQQGQIRLHGKLTTDRATIILPNEGAPKLGSDVVVRSAAKDREAQAANQAHAAVQAETAKPPDIAITLNLGRDFALQGHGITTRLTGEVDIRNSAVPNAPPRVTGEVRTEEGRYRAWGQMLDVETGLIRFNGAYDNPSLDILALRPNISVRAGVQVSGSTQAPRVRLYSDPELPDAEKLSWVVLGRDAAAGGAEAAVLQQAALALLGRSGSNNTAANAASRLGLDEIGFKGPSTGEDASAAALTFGKRLSKDLYVTYERSLSGTLGTLYIFYDLSRRLTLRGQTGEKSAVDIIYTMKYD